MQVPYDSCVCERHWVLKRCWLMVLLPCMRITLMHYCRILQQPFMFCVMLLWAFADTFLFVQSLSLTLTVMLWRSDLNLWSQNMAEKSLHLFKADRQCMCALKNKTNISTHVKYDAKFILLCCVKVTVIVPQKMQYFSLIVVYFCFLWTK